jgi:tetratricopeptide (TPR) repeat protein
MNVTELPSTSLTIDQAHQQAITHHQAGNLQEAERLYRAILQAQPNHPDANHNLGVLAVQVNQALAGLPHFKAALEANPNQAQYWLSYIDSLIQAGQYENARQVLEQGRACGLKGEAVDVIAGRLESTALRSLPEPTTEEVEHLVTLFNQCRYTETETIARGLTDRFPDHGFGWKVLGVVLKSQGHVVEALEPMQKAAALLPEDAEAHSNLGTTLNQLDRLEEAEASYRRALEIKPHPCPAHNPHSAVSF